MNKKGFFRNLIEKIEYYLPMTLSSFVIFIFVIYLFIVVGRTVWANYNSNKEIQKEQDRVVELEETIAYLKNQINYFQTYTYKEKEARAKLGYKATGEFVIALPIDKEEDKVEDRSLKENDIKTPNYRLWWSYFFGG